MDGLQLISAELVIGEWQLAAQTVATVIGYGGCGVPAQAMAATWCGCVTWRSAAGW